MASPLFGPNNEQLLRQIEQARQQRQQTPAQSIPQQPQPQQVPPASPPPPSDVSSRADAALLAAQQLQDQLSVNRQRREQEAGQALQSVEEADRFAQNAQIARQVADESEALSMQQKQQADQLAQIHQQEDAAEEAQAAQAFQAAKDAEDVRIAQDPQVFQQVKPEVAQALGIDVKALNEEVENTYKEVQGIFAGQLDANNARQLELAKKIEAGEGFNKNEKIALGMAALLPIIIGAARGNLGAGIATAGQALSQFGAAKQGEQRQALAERGALEDRQLALAQGKLKNVGLFTDQKGKISDISIRQAQAAEESAQRELQNQGIRFNNVARLEKAKQEKVLTKEKILDFQQKLEKLEKGGVADEKVTDAQGKLAMFAVRTEQAEDIFSALEKDGFSPVEGEGWTPNRLKRAERQKYDQAQRNFVNAVLRPESGAAISEEEFENARQQYFPQPGDGPEVVAQKKANRLTAIAGLKAQAGSTAISKIYNLLGDSQPVSQVEQSAQAAPQVDLSQMSDEELQRIIQGGM